MTDVPPSAMVTAVSVHPEEVTAPAVLVSHLLERVFSLNLVIVPAFLLAIGTPEPTL
jgi:hypothetical protein